MLVEVGMKGESLVVSWLGDVMGKPFCLHVIRDYEWSDDVEDKADLERK